MDPKLNLAATTSLGGRTLKVNIYVAGGRGGGGEEKEEEGGGGEGDRRRLEEEGGGGVSSSILTIKNTQNVTWKAF